MSRKRKPFESGDVTGETSRPMLHGRRRKPHRFRRWITIISLSMLIVVIAGYYLLTDEARLRRYTESYLQRFFTTRVSVSSASFRFFDGIQLSGVSVADIGTEEHSLLKCDEVLLRHDPTQLLLGQLHIEEIIATKPVCRAVLDNKDSKFNFQHILRLSAESKTKEFPPLPVIRLRESQVQVYRHQDSRDDHIEDIQVNLHGRPAPAGWPAYELEWSGITDRRSSGLVEIDFVRRLMIDKSGGTPWLSIESALMAVEAAAPGTQRWIEVLGLVGRLRLVNYKIPFGEYTKDQLQIAVEFENAGLSVPVNKDEQSLPPSGRFVHLEQVTGSVIVDASGAKASVSGLFNDSKCSAQAKLFGNVGRGVPLNEVGFDLDISVEHLALPRNDRDIAPAEARFVNNWLRLQKFYRNFDPHGTVNARVVLEKAEGAAEKIQLLHAIVEPLGADVSNMHFPYRVTDVNGTVKIIDDGSCTLNLTGRHGSGELYVNGYLEGIKKTDAAELIIAGSRIPLDDNLCEALKEKQRKTWDTFSPDGFADMHVYMTRPESKDQNSSKWTVFVDADLKGAEATFKGFPYRISGLTGNVSIGPGYFDVYRLNGFAGGGDVEISGEAITKSGVLDDLDLTVDAKGVYFENDLFRALSGSARERLEAFSPQGRYDLAARLSYDKNLGKIIYDIAAQLDSVSVCHKDWPIAVSSITGDVFIQPERIEIFQVKGSVGTGTVAVNGFIHEGTKGPFRDLTIQADQVELTGQRREALPPVVREAIAPWRITGPFGVITHLTTEIVNGITEHRHSTRLFPAGATVNHAEFPYPVDLMGGEVIVKNETVELKEICGRSGGAVLVANGYIRRDPSGDDVSLNFDLTGLQFNEKLRDAVPWRLRRWWNEIHPAGVFDVRDGVIEYSKPVNSPQPDWKVAGKIDMFNCQFDLGPKFREVNGIVDLYGSVTGPLRDVPLSGNLQLDNCRINDWTLEEVHGECLRDGGSNRWTFTDLSASIYGGKVVGSLELEPSGYGTHYDLKGVVQRMGLEGYVNDKRAPEFELPPVEMDGYVDGRFFVTGNSDNISSQRGGGRIVLKNAQLYRLPLLLTVLHVINLSVPEESVFQEVSADFFIVGDVLQMHDLLLKGKALAMIGSGTMALSTQELDIKLVTVSPHRWAKLPIMTELLEGAARELVEVAVTGTPQKPQATARPLRGLEKAINTLVIPDD